MSEEPGKKDGDQEIEIEDLFVDLDYLEKKIGRVFKRLKRVLREHRKSLRNRDLK